MAAFKPTTSKSHSSLLVAIRAHAQLQILLQPFNPKSRYLTCWATVLNDVRDLYCILKIPFEIILSLF
jgi:hypothetical protein